MKQRKHAQQKNWSFVKLDQCGELYCGQSASVKEVNITGQGCPYFTGPEQWDGQTLHLTKWTEHPRRLVPEGCIFITVKGAGVGTLFPGMAGAIGRDIYAYRVHETLDFDYVYYALKHTVEQVVGRAQGDIPGLSKSHILDHEISLPGIDQQRRIVAKMEELFSELDNGVESLKIAQEQLRIYRAAVLENAIDSLAGSEAQQMPLSELVGTIQQGWSPKCELNRVPVEDEWAVIKTTAVQPMKYISEECKPLPLSFEPRPHLEVRVGDLLMTRKGPRTRTGVVCLVRNTRYRSLLCDTVYRFRCNTSIVRPEYLELALNAPSVVAEIDRRKAGISDSGISLNHPKIKSISLLVPTSLSAQELIVGYVANKISLIEQLESEIERNLIRAESMRRSILGAAFSGQLIPQDLDDGSASVLEGKSRPKLLATATAGK